MTLQPIPPGSTIGIFGGGQLGRMTVLAAARFGYQCHVFTSDLNSPASQVATSTTVASYDDNNALRVFSAAVDVATFEFENIPIDSIRFVEEQVPVYPGWKVLSIAQNRVQEKAFFNFVGLETAQWRCIANQDSLVRAVSEIGLPAVLKSARFGYDGKGQIRIDDRASLERISYPADDEAMVLEAYVDFSKEISVIVARGMDGAWVAFDPVENIHVDHILHTSVAPAQLPPSLTAAAINACYTLASALDLVGVLAVEMFVTRDGRLLINEMAPRPHNSGHWTIDACYTNQFEQFVRAICGLPLGTTKRHSDARMTNLLGNDVLRWSDFLNDPLACLYLYGKKEIYPSRKMGHITYLAPRAKVTTE